MSKMVRGRSGRDWAKQGEIYRLMLVRSEILNPKERVRVMDEAFSCFENALRCYHPIEDKDESAVAWVLAHRAACYIMRGNYKKAIAEFEESLKHRPKYAWAVANKADALRLWGIEELLDQHLEIAQEKLNLAVETFSRAIEIETNYAWAYGHRGVAYRYMGLNEEERRKYNELAVADFTKALSISKEYAWALVYRSVSYKILARWKPELWQNAYLDLATAAVTYPDVFKEGIASMVLGDVSSSGGTLSA